MPTGDQRQQVIMPELNDNKLVVGHCDFDHPDKLQEREEQRKLFEKEKQAHAEEKLRRLLEKVEQQKQNDKPKVAMRFDANKLRLDLIPVEFLIELARVYTIGALKYDDDNWRKGMPWRKVYRPIWSHFFKWLSGHTIDSETGCHHLAMVAWNCATLFMYQLHKLGTDDRFKFDIDENFNWVHNHLGIGLEDSKITELKDKYKQQRENAK